MKPEPIDDNEVLTEKSASLERVLRRSRTIKATINEAAGRLASTTAVLKDKKASSPPESVEQAIYQYDEVEAEVANAAQGLTQVNTALAAEVWERVGIESELADTRADLAAARDDLSESQASGHEAVRLALHDPLTGLPNRALFDQGLAHALVQARRHGWGLAVLFIDIDLFKAINDLYGHHVGDEALLIIADRLRSSVRAADMVSRWGGDEFVCLLLEVGQAAEVTSLARGMCDRIAEQFESGGATLSLGCSIGIAMYPGDGESADVLLKNADVAMYRAKRTPEKVAQFGFSQPPSGGNGQRAR